MSPFVKVGFAFLGVGVFVLVYFLFLVNYFKNNPPTKDAQLDKGLSKIDKGLSEINQTLTKGFKDTSEKLDRLNKDDKSK